MQQQKLEGYGSGFNESRSATWLFASCYENIPRRTHNMVKYAVLWIRNTEYGIRCFFDPRIRDPDPGWKKVLIRIRDEHPRLFFRELRNSLWGLKILKFFDVDPESF